MIFLQKHKKSKTWKLWIQFTKDNVAKVKNLLILLKLIKYMIIVHQNAKRHINPF